MKKFLLFFITLFAGIFIFAWVLKFVGWQTIKESLLIFTGWHGATIFGLTLLAAAIGTLKWKEILKGEGIEISLSKIFGPYLAGLSIMYLAPVIILGGELFRAHSLKEKHSVSWSKGMASVIIDRILEWTVTLTIIFLGLNIFIYKISLLPEKILIIFGTAFVLFLAAIGYLYFKIFKKESIIEIIAGMFGLNGIKEKKSFLQIEGEIFSFFKIRNRFMWMALAISFLRAFILWARAWVLIVFLGKNIGGVIALSVLGFTYIASLIPIPASLGSHEAIQSFVFNSLGLGIPIATAFTMIIRAAEILLALAGVVVIFKQGLEFIKNITLRKAENITHKTNYDKSQQSN